ncbi:MULTISPECIES: hypothetical protein [Streptomyces]|uniref:Uncharacterized protein n=1 Tax=Streptomyces solicathayae TaxID=3081768 RepID=A0ABZ0LS80_9ACTN|nr:hypothetical protein [Streptomyces sp. HUAS YS2]WOX22347.1 hypothetical protein R2D22_13460 [Streptomyces sp. HUAS YS2]
MKDLVAKVPGFEEAYEAHIIGEGGVLPHVFFFVDVVDETVRSYLGEGDPDGPDWRQVLAFLEEESRRAVPGAYPVIVTSFLDGLPYQGQSGCGIEAHLGPVMAAKFAELRPWWPGSP